MDESAQTYSAEELATLASVPRRTIRYYVSLGLLDRPIGETRAAHYTREHLRQLLEIRRLTEQGLSLERVRDVLRDKAEPPPATRARRPGDVEVRTHVHVAPGVDVVIEPQSAGLAPEQLRRFVREMRAAFERATQEQEE
jgi:DNA-binding transcriptional MerR regulator